MKRYTFKVSCAWGELDDVLISWYTDNGVYVGSIHMNIEQANKLVSDINVAVIQAQELDEGYRQTFEGEYYQRLLPLVEKPIDITL